MSDPVQANNMFAFELWQRTARGNLAVSPASLSFALAMVAAGASGDTAAELQHVLNGAELDAWAKLAAAILDPKRTLELRMANRLFGDRAYSFEQGFLDRTRALGAPLEALDFRTPQARAAINDWVSRRTNGKIVDLLPDGAVGPMTRLVLANAIYFGAEWRTKFKREMTRDAPFTTAAEKIMTPTMHATASYRLAKLDGITMLEMPYKGDALMYIVLPDRADGLADVERRVDAAAFARWRAALVGQRVAVALPRFTIDAPAALELSPLLAALGMPSAFDPRRADFSAMAKRSDPREQLYLAAVFHKAFVKVDEKGTEAAGATAAVMAERGAMPQPATSFAADRPFVFAIVDATGIVLFLGRLEDPLSGLDPSPPS